ncbi:gamma-aminobutyric acid type B receptor subunit 1-like [Gadus macrocephalus]|uniref:gamma-aminobutyric acid type B receptor subunit 1-like n=1 Tax=Gadus macrocephalus TaxID=80720 RepID=UPI0028CB1ABC|nr:gamma-aminobutyric acid type B receptor subunit 1-like [Gadus macrocephalus]
MALLPPRVISGTRRPQPQTQRRSKGMALFLLLLIVSALPSSAAVRNTSAGCAIIRPPRDGGIRYRGLTQEQIRSVQVLPVDYEIEYICRGNRVIVGPKVRKCLPDGTWTDLTQHSRCLLLCARVWTSLENGRVSHWPPGPPVEGTVLSYSCLPGFILIGRNSTHCNKMGKWDTPKPVCHYDRHYTGEIAPLVMCECMLLHNSV